MAFTSEQQSAITLEIANRIADATRPLGVQVDADRLQIDVVNAKQAENAEAHSMH